MQTMGLARFPLTNPIKMWYHPNTIGATSGAKYMKIGLSDEEAAELLWWALSEPAGALIYTADRPNTMQILYKVRRRDPELQDLHIKQRPEGLVIWHARNPAVQDHLRSQSSRAGLKGDLW